MSSLPRYNEALALLLRLSNMNLTVERNNYNAVWPCSCNLIQLDGIIAAMLKSVAFSSHTSLSVLLRVSDSDYWLTQGNF